MILYMILYMISYSEQDCVVVLAPFPNNPNPVQSFNVKTDFELQGDGLASAATVTRQFYTASGTICALEVPRQIHSATGATVAGSTR